jgi:hypothetical protein
MIRPSPEETQVGLFFLCSLIRLITPHTQSVLASSRTKGHTVDWDENDRADLLRRLLAQLPNLVDVDIELVDQSQALADPVLDNLASRQGLRKLRLNLHPSLSASRIIKLLSTDLSNLNTVRLTCTDPLAPVSGAEPPELGGLELVETLASMPQLETHHLAGVSRVDGSWAIPFASGGLSDLSLLCRRPELDLAGLDAILAVHNTLKQLTLVNVPGLRVDKAASAQGPQYKLNRLESFSIDASQGEEYLGRFSSSPIRYLEVSGSGSRWQTRG